MLAHGTARFCGIARGNAGNDTLNGGTGNDSMTGDAGDDTYVVDAPGDSVNENAGGGIDTIQTAQTTFTLNLGALANVENLTFTSASASTGTGNGLDNVIRGTSANDNLSGLGGSDRIDGAGGNDVLSGGAGVDFLTGGAGNDTLNGGTGNDFFIFGSGTNIDTIQDFDANPGGGQDLIDVSARGITAANFAAQVSLSSEVVGGILGTLITMGTDQIHLTGVTLPNVSQADFILAA